MMSGHSLLILSHEFPPLGGGAGRNLLQLCLELHKRGYRIRVVTGRPPAAKNEAVPFRLDYVKSWRGQLFETNLFSMARFVISVLWYLRREPRAGYDTLLSNMAIPAGVAGALCRHAAKRHVVWHHGSDVHGGKTAGASWMQRRILAYVWRRTDACCFVSESLSQIAGSYGLPGKPHIVPVSVSAATQDKPQQSGMYLLFLGRLEHVKNPLLLVESVAFLAAAGVTLPLVRIVGSGKLGRKIQAGLAQRGLSQLVSMEPAVDGCKARELIKGAYALILTSNVEGLNTTIIEAASAGVPSVGADIPGINDFVEHEKNGLLYKRGSSIELADRIQQIISDRRLRDRLGNSAALKAAVFTPEQAANEFEMALAIPQRTTHGGDR